MRQSYFCCIIQQKLGTAHHFSVGESRLEIINSSIGEDDHYQCESVPAKPGLVEGDKSP